MYDTFCIDSPAFSKKRVTGLGLPSDRVSMENGAISTNSQRWCLIIDPQLQGVFWIKNKETDNGLVVTRMGHPKMVTESACAHSYY